jgi:hypothetical protein
MHTHLKGRIFHARGRSFLVLHEDADGPEWVRVREINAGRAEHRMRAEEIRAHIGEPAIARHGGDVSPIPER